jgi:6-phosphofructokinase 1
MLAEIREAYGRDGWAVIVICENQRDDSGRPLGSDVPVYVDPHGHPYFEGAGAHLARVVQAELGLRTRYDRPGSLQRSSASALSSVDVKEARSAGAEAVRLALAGESDVMVAIQRSPGVSYAAHFTTIPLDEVAHHERKMPDEFIASSGTDVTQAFYEYAQPLIGDPLPRVVQLP